MRKFSAIALMAVAAMSANAAILWDNGPMVTHPGGGFGGADASRLQSTSLGLTINGFGLGAATSVWLADDFTIGAGQSWNLSSFTAYGYQTNGLVSNLLTDLRIQIFSGDPNTGTLIFGDTATNRLTSSAFTNIYRDSETTVGNSARAVMSATGNLNLNLGPGTYWVAWSAVGSFNPTGSVFAPPVTILGQTGKAGANGIQSTTGGGATTFTAALLDGAAPQDMPFIIQGTPVPEPASMAALGIGALALLRRRRK